jgi:hypothetical protein
VAESHDQDARIFSSLGQCLEAVRDIDDLNAPPPRNSIFLTVVEKLEAFAWAYEGRPEQVPILRGLATSARMLARQRDALAESSFRKLTEIEPRKSAHHYNLGLFHKTRGRFAEGVTSNQIAVSLADEVTDSYEWNLGICATGAGNTAVALDVWKRMGQAIEIGRFGLPEGSYAQCKVRLAERPLAERTADADDPGAEETIWIERLSPCHGSSVACSTRSWASTMATSSSSTARQSRITLMVKCRFQSFHIWQRLSGETTSYSISQGRRTSRDN